MRRELDLIFIKQKNNSLTGVAVLKRYYYKIKRLMYVSDVTEIARRYFVMNAFDGALTMLGILVGAHMSGHSNISLIVSMGVAASIAMGISGFSGAYLTERAERIRELKRLEAAMLVDLGDTLHGEASRFASFVTALVFGLSPAVAAFIILAPYLLAGFGFLEEAYAFVYSLTITAVVLFGLGAYLASVSDENLTVYGIKMLFVGVVTAAASMVVGLVFGGRV